MSTKVEEAVTSTLAAVVEMTPTADGDRQHKNFRGERKGSIRLHYEVSI